MAVTLDSLKNNDSPFIIRSAHSGLAVTANGTNAALTQQQYDERSEQQWTFVANGDGTFRIQNGASDQVMDVDGGWKSGGTKILCCSWHGGENQRWRVTEIGGGQFRIDSVRSGLTLDVRDKSAAAGAGIIQWGHNGAKNQSWSITSVAQTRLKPAAETRKFVIKAAHSGLVLGAMSTSVPLTVQAEAEADNRQWKLIATEDGTFRIESVATGQVLDIEDSSTSNGGRAFVWNWHGGPNQRWRLIELGDGFFRIDNVKSGLSLDVRGESKSAGAEVVQWPYRGEDHQRWQIFEILPKTPKNPTKKRKRQWDIRGLLEMNSPGAD